MRTPAEAKAMIAATGLSVGEWAAKNGLQEQVVRDLLRGKTAPHKSKAYMAAAALGMLPAQQQPTPQESEASMPSVEARAVSSSALKEAAGWVDDARFQLAILKDRIDALDSIRMAMESLRSARTAIINSFPKVIRDGYAARAAELDRGRK